MSIKRLAPLALLCAIACYTEDPNLGDPVARVHITDSPFPFDSVASVDIYVVRVEATEQPDTSGFGAWTTIAEPRRSFDLLTLQQGTTAFVGAGQLPAGRYRAVRLVIDTDSSAITLYDGSPAVVNWQGSGEVALYALVEGGVDVPSGGADIVIDFDVGRSFLYQGGNQFTLLPWIRAVNAAATGAIAGVVTRASGGGPLPVPNVAVTVYRGDPYGPSYTWAVVATGRTDSSGAYRVAFLMPADYIVHLEPREILSLQSSYLSGVTVTVGQTASGSVTLQGIGANGGLTIIGPTQVTVGNWIGLTALVVDSAGVQIPSPTVFWDTETDTSSTILIATGPTTDSVLVMGLRAGVARLTATSGLVADTTTIIVLGSALPVEAVSVVGSSTLSVGDSTYYDADLRDSLGTRLFGRPVSWFSSDESVLRLDYAYSVYVQVRALKAGTVTLTATSEGKTGSMTVTVH